MEQELRKLLAYAPLSIGCDPELFISQGNKIVGSEKVIPKEGITGSGKVVLDGVQVELNPSPSACRASLGYAMRDLFHRLHTQLANQKASASFQDVIEISKEELDSLSEASRVFGCAPSKNLYDSQAKIEVDPAVYRKRSAGGHIHLGFCGEGAHGKILYDVPAGRLVAMLDIFLGNTCVLLDRSPEAKERRKVYGRAGEYRTPAFGIEYRTLSNFWLKSPVLAHFCWGMARFSIYPVWTTLIGKLPLTTSHPKKVVLKGGIYVQEEDPSSTFIFADFPGGSKCQIQLDRGQFLDGQLVSPEQFQWDAESEILSKVDLDRVRYAINENDFDEAMRNFQPVAEFISDHAMNNELYATGNYGCTPLWKESLEDFLYFVHKGTDHWFKQEPLAAWTAAGDLHCRGWESFLVKTVRNEHRAQKAA